MRKLLNKRNERYDTVLLFAIVCLLLVGVFMVASSSWSEGIKEGESGVYFLKRHLAFLSLGIVVGYTGYILPIKVIRKFSGLLWSLSIFLCLLLYTNLAFSVNGSARWLLIPGTSFRFMPSDLLKYSSIFFVANLIDVYRKNGRKEGFLLILGIIGISVGLVIVRDFSSAVVIGITLMAMFFVAGLKFVELFTIGFLSLGGFYAMLMVFSYRVERLMSFRDPFDDIADTDWQLANSLYALGIGSISGVGYFQSRQKYSYLPESYNDFIFAILGEEFGFLGTVSVILLFLVFVVRGFKIIFRRQNLFEQLVALGITTSIAIQAFFNMGVASGILPVTGITLPYISYGGTALVLVMGMSGVLLKLSRS